MYKDILSRNTVNPKISLKNYYKYPLAVRNRIVKSIWDGSVEILNSSKEVSYLINLHLAYEYTLVFSVKELVNDLISAISGYTRPSEYEKPDSIVDLFADNGFNMSMYNELKDKLDFYSAIYITYCMNYPLNLDNLLEIVNQDAQMPIKRLVYLNKLFKQKFYNLSIGEFLDKAYEAAEGYRLNNSGHQPYRLLVLAEGITEKTLLPVFAKKMGMDFAKLGVQIVASGGKNQVLKLYEDYSVKLNLPIFIILDADAESIAAEIQQNLRVEDRIFIIPEGEFEDILPVKLICKALNKHFKLTGSVIPCEIEAGQRMSLILYEIWKKKGFGSFNKAEFAAIIAEYVDQECDMSVSIKKIFEIMRNMIR